MAGASSASSAGSPKPAPEQPATEAPQPTAVPPATEPAPTQSAPVAEPRPAPATRPPSAATPARPAAAPPPPPPTPTVKEGDLVQPGAGVRPPVLVSIDRPEYPPVARRLRVEGTVLMSLLVDEKGQVLDVRLESGIRQNVGINEVALEAARSAKFRPATKDGVRVKMWYQLKVPFKL